MVSLVSFGTMGLAFEAAVRKINTLWDRMDASHGRQSDRRATDPSRGRQSDRDASWDRDTNNNTNACFGGGHRIETFPGQPRERLVPRNSEARGH